MQIIRISFLDMAHRDIERIKRYIKEREDNGAEGNNNAPMGRTNERRKYPRAAMPRGNDALISIKVSLDGPATALDKPIELSENSASIAYRGDTPVSHGMEIEKVVISLPGDTIECRGRVVSIVKEND